MPMAKADDTASGRVKVPFMFRQDGGIAITTQREIEPLVNIHRKGS